MAEDKTPPAQDNELRQRNREEQARRSRRRGRQLLGLALAMLIVVGAVSIVQRGYELVQAMMQSSEEEIQEYRERIKFPVYFDMLPFDSVESIDEDIVKECGIWWTLEQQSSELDRDEDGNVLIPVLQVERWATSLLGPDFQFEEHGDFTDTVQDISYQYDADSEQYVVPGTSLQPMYEPRVMEIQNEGGGIKRVVVGYVATVGNNNEIIESVDYDHPVRFMDYVFRRDGSEYYLIRLERNTTYQVSGSASTSASASGSASGSTGSSGSGGTSTSQAGGGTEEEQTQTDQATSGAPPE